MSNLVGGWCMRYQLPWPAIKVCESKPTQPGHPFLLGNECQRTFGFAPEDKWNTLQYTLQKTLIDCDTLIRIHYACMVQLYRRPRACSSGVAQANGWKMAITQISTDRGRERERDVSDWAKAVRQCADIYQLLMKVNINIECRSSWQAGSITCHCDMLQCTLSVSYAAATENTCQCVQHEKGNF